MNAHFQRGRLLLDQGRFDLAEQELRQALALDPQEPSAHASLALALLGQDRLAEAKTEVEQAIGLAPDWCYAHYVLAVVLQTQDDLKGAETAIREAIRLDPEDAAYRARLASIHLERKDWRLALESAEEGLRIDPEHVGCNNHRATALVKLGRHAEAGATLEAALAREPENATTHANRGWSLLESNDPARALEHFREALRLEPNYEYARLGIIEALKARHFIYRQLLRYFLWMARLKPGAQWGVILGAYFGMKLLGGLMNAQPGLAVVILPVMVGYLGFAYFSWTASTMFNLTLRLDKFGRYALSRDELLAANSVGLCLLFGLGALVAWLVSGVGAWGLASVGAALLVIPVAGTFRCQTPKSRLILAVYTLALVVIGLVALAGTLLGHPDAGALAPIYFLGVLVFTWIGNLVINRF